MWKREMISVSQLVAVLARVVEADPVLQSVWVTGELVDVKPHPSSGHWYFTLGDQNARLRMVMFRQDAATLEGRPEVGQLVAVFGQVRVYRPQGTVQLYARRIEPLGAGAEQRALEELLARLRAEGLLSRPKRRLPTLPRAVGVVTSRDGAAVQDIITVASRRFPGLPLVVAPTAVQGQSAPTQIAAALARIAQHPRVDVVIVARGGGSREDLGAFNDERVVRAVFNCPKPVVSAVGHEIDTTLVDLVSDTRAPTPSAAAELAVPERAQLSRAVAVQRDRAARWLQARVAAHRRHLAGFLEHGVLRNPDRLLADRRVMVDRMRDRSETRFRWVVERRRRTVAELTSRLSGLDPTAVLARGFALVTDAAARPVTASGIARGQELTVAWADGAWRVAARTPLEAGETRTADGEARQDGRGDGPV